MRKRASDTAVIAAKVPPRTKGDDGESHNVSVRKIENGYLIDESHCKNGEYTSTCRFSAEKPSLDNADPSPDQGSPLRQAIEIAKGRD